MRPSTPLTTVPSARQPWLISKNGSRLTPRRQSGWSTRSATGRRGTLIFDSQVWCDLGCGSGVAAAAVLGEPYPGRAVLVDLAEEAIRAAEERIEAGEVHAFRADLTDEQDLTLVREALLTDLPETGCITCFEVIEHLSTFVPLLELLVEAAATGRYTVLLSVPNDAFWSMQNPYHHTSWGDEAFEELRRLLPEDHVLAQQLEVRGSALVRADGKAASERQASFALPDAVVPSHSSPPSALGASRSRSRCWRRCSIATPSGCGTASARAISRSFALSQARRASHRPLRERRLPPERPPPLRRRVDGRAACAQADRQAWVARRPRPRADAGRPELAVPDAGGAPRARARGGCGGAFRRGRRDLVGDDEPPLRTSRRDRHAYFVQSLEDRFYRPSEPERLGAALTHDLPVSFITEARWIAETLEELRPGAPVLLRAQRHRQGRLRARRRQPDGASTARCGSSSRATPTSGSRASARRWRRCARCASRTR